ncbi:Uncharacterised protein [uncultured archaeon]|nr:Uncharacterised protein [uncultured archaeon]
MQVILAISPDLTDSGAITDILTADVTRLALALDESDQVRPSESVPCTLKSRVELDAIFMFGENTWNSPGDRPSTLSRASPFSDRITLVRSSVPVFVTRQVRLTSSPTKASTSEGVTFRPIPGEMTLMWMLPISWTA